MHLPIESSKVKSYKNEVINTLLSNGQITRGEYALLFEEKDMNVWEKDQAFNAVLKKIIGLQNRKETLTLDFINFPHFTFNNFRFTPKQNISFLYATFSGEADFSNATFTGETHFSNAVFFDESDFWDATFLEGAHFSSTTFSALADFWGTTFSKEADFWGASFSDLAHFSDAIFLGFADYSSATFSGTADLSDASFKKLADFSNTMFMKPADLSGTSFSDLANFSNAMFFRLANFSSAIFSGLAQFLGTSSESIINFSYASFNEVDFENANFHRPNFLHMCTDADTHLLPLSQKNFSNKESARLVRAYFEQQNNITEANKYFKIEQELYLQSLNNKNTNKEGKEMRVENKNTIRIALYLNKFVSDFGTDWIRTLIVMLGFSFLAGFFYVFISDDTVPILSQTRYAYLWTIIGFILSVSLYISYHFKTYLYTWGIIVVYILLLLLGSFRSIVNDIANLINPLNVFNIQEYFQDIALYGMMTKLIMVGLLYQFIMAFRQNTRRR